MVCLNRKLPINLIQMRTELIKEIDYIIDNKLYFLDVIFSSLKNDIKNDENKYNNKIDKLKNNIIKEIKNKINADNFIYRIIDDDHCTFKHKRGKNEGHYCSKKINTNLEGQKKDYLCCTHSKKHVPKKKGINKGNHTSPSNNITINLNDIKNVDKYSQPNNCLNIRKSLHDKSNYIKKNIKNKKNTYVNSSILNSFKKSINNSVNDNFHKNTVCNHKEKQLCHNIKKHGYCNFKHFSNEILLTDFIEKTKYDNGHYNNLSFSKNQIETY